jgi:lactate dehydrogenase-like 2-hydroxyacid dehydrogenase
MNKIAILDAKVIADNQILKMFEQFGDVTIWQTTNPVERIEHIGDATIVITNKVLMEKEIMDACPTIKLICLTATGMNNVDLEYAKERGIFVKNVGGYSTDSVAQHTFSMLLYMISQPAYYDNFVKSGKYAKLDVFCHFGPGFWELKGKRWGIIGLGAIGRKVAEIATAFGCEVVYYSTSGANDTDDYKRVDLDELLKTSRIISIHAPLNDNTRNLISYPQLQKMRQDAILINVGRGNIVDESALAKALNENLIYGACIDVLANEPIKTDNPLLQIIDKERLFISPHIAWISEEALKTLLNKTVANIQDFLNS